MKKQNNLKYCPCCKQTKNIINFNNNKNTKDGLYIYCKECVKNKAHKRYVINKIKILKQNNEWKKQNSKHMLKLSTKWAKENPEKRKTTYKKYEENNKPKRRNWHLVKTYGITLTEYDSILKSQNNVCAICGEKESNTNNNGSIKPLSVDHNHKTGDVRGLLCDKCNNGLGKFRDNIEILNKAIKYLKGDKNAS